MESVRFTRKILSEPLGFPEFCPFVGQEVEITIRTAPSDQAISSIADRRKNLIGSVLRYDDPFGPAIPVDDWDACQ